MSSDTIQEKPDERAAAGLPPGFLIYDEDDQLAGDQPLLEALKGNTYSSPNLDCREVLRYLAGQTPGRPLPGQN